MLWTSRVKIYFALLTFFDFFIVSLQHTNRTNYDERENFHSRICEPSTDDCGQSVCSMGFSINNLYAIKRWYLFYYQRIEKFYQVGKKFNIENLSTDLSTLPNTFGRIPWKHHIMIIANVATLEEAFFYISKCCNENWSRSMLETQMKSKLYERQGAAVTNFDATFPISQEGLLQDILKDPYNFDFLSMKKDYDERDLE